MIGTELKTFTESILDGLTIEETFFYQLLNVAKNKLESERIWQYLKKLNSSNTASSGNNYTTGFTLPSDFAVDYKLYVGKDNEFFPVAFEEQHLFRNVSNHYYVDIVGDKFYLLGNTVSETIYFYYKRFTPEIGSSTSPVFPSRFHPLLGYYVAAYFQVGVDVDDIFARMGPENKLAAIELQRSMIAWDTDLSVRSQNDQIGVASSFPGLQLGDM